MLGDIAMKATVTTLAGLALAVVAPARAADAPAATAEHACRIIVVGTSTPSTWKLAADAEQRRLATLPRTATEDCRTIELHVTLDGALMVLTTIRGQQAVRPIASPDELDATIDALLVTIPSPPAPAASASPATATDDASTPPPGGGPASVPDDHVAPARGAHVDGAFPFPVFVEAGVGARIVGPGGWAAPSFDVRASTTIADWTLGAFFAWEPTYLGVPFTDQDLIETSSFALGGLFGRRWRLGSALSLAINGRLALGWFDESRDAESESAEIGLRRLEARIGAEGSLGIRITHEFSIRPRVAFEVMPSFLARSDLQDPRVPAAPTYALTLGVAGELGFAPSVR